MEEAIKKFSTQFNFEPDIQNKESFKPAQSFVLAGMGGSHLAAGLLKMSNPDLDLYIHRDYGLPALSHKKFKDSLFIASSYSGNTEEVLDFAHKAHEEKYQVAVIARTGKLIEFAQKNNLPYIQLPDVGIQPRAALGFSLVAMAKFTNNEKLLADLRALSFHINTVAREDEGKVLAQTLAGKIPVIYSSRSNVSLAYTWKITMNETAKIPAFYNILPELNHNEMTGYDVIESTRSLSEKFHFIFLTDELDHPKVTQRATVTQQLLEERGFPTSTIRITGASRWESVFSTILLAEWTALYISRAYGTESEQVPMVEEFKKRIA